MNYQNLRGQPHAVLMRVDLHSANISRENVDDHSTLTNLAIFATA